LSAGTLTALAGLFIQVSPRNTLPVHISEYQAGTLFLLVGLFIEPQDPRTIVPLQFTKYWYPEENKLLKSQVNLLLLDGLST
jgi:hypothetical protein